MVCATLSSIERTVVVAYLAYSSQLIVTSSSAAFCPSISLRQQAASAQHRVPALQDGIPDFSPSPGPMAVSGLFALSSSPAFQGRRLPDAAAEVAGAIQRAPLGYPQRRREPLALRGVLVQHGVGDPRAKELRAP